MTPAEVYQGMGAVILKMSEEIKKQEFRKHRMHQSAAAKLKKADPEPLLRNSKRISTNSDNGHVLLGWDHNIEEERSVAIAAKVSQAWKYGGGMIAALIVGPPLIVITGFRYLLLFLQRTTRKCTYSVRSVKLTCCADIVAG